MSLDKSLLVACGDAVVVATARHVVVVGDVVAIVGVAAADDVVVVVGATAAVVVWMHQCLMRPCTSPVVVTPTGNEPSWWDQ